MMEEKIQTHKSGTPKKVVIAIKNLKKSFGKLEVLKDINVQIYEGENLVVLGKSGTGKSVLIKCIVGLMDLDDGEIIVFDENIKEMNTESLSKIRRRIGFLFQSGALYDSMNVKQNLEFPLLRSPTKFSQEEIDKKTNEALSHVGLEKAILQMPSQLSGGQRKRISLARTIVTNPEIMLYDEPTTGLDPVTSDEISGLIRDVQRQYKTSSIIITHDINCVRSVADRIVMLKDGIVYKEGDLASFESSDDPEIKSFFK